MITLKFKKKKIQEMKWYSNLVPKSKKYALKNLET